MPRHSLAFLIATLHASTTHLKVAPSFEQARGQWPDPAIKFSAATEDYRLLLGESFAKIVTSDGQISFEPVGGRLTSPIAGAPAVTSSNYFVGPNAITKVLHFSRVTYRAVWPGIDLIFKVSGTSIEYDFAVDPYADASVIAIRFNGAMLEIESSGAIGITTGKAKLRQEPPIAIQHSRRISVDADIRGNTLRLHPRNYDPAQALLIDPILTASSHLPFTIDETSARIAAGPDGTIVVAGTVWGWLGFFGVGYQSPPAGGTDVVVVKLSADLNSIVFITYIGGGQHESLGGLAVDSHGNILIAGQTSSSDFPTTPGAFQTAFQAQGDSAFISKLSADGKVLVFSTFLSGSERGDANAIAVDREDNVIAAGFTIGKGFPTTAGSYRPVPSEKSLDAWVAKLPPTGTPPIFVTTFGGSSFDRGYQLNVDPAGNVFLGGITESTDLPVTQTAVQTEVKGSFDVFLAQFSADGRSLLYCTYLGGNAYEFPNSIELGSAGDVFVGGFTNSSSFPRVPDVGARYYPFASMFVTKLNTRSRDINFSRLDGRANSSVAVALASQSSGHLRVFGYTGDRTMPQSGDALSPSPMPFGIGQSAWIATIDPGGNLSEASLLYGSPRDPATPVRLGEEPFDKTQLLRAVKSGPNEALVLSASASTRFPATFGAFLDRPFATGYFLRGLAVSRIDFASKCAFTFSTAAIAFPASGGSQTVDVITTPECNWTVSPDQYWLGLQPLSRTQFRVSAPASTGPARSGQIAVGGKVLRVDQAAAPAQPIR